MTTEAEETCKKLDYNYAHAKKLQVGNIITCTHFSQGYYDSNGHICPDEYSGQHDRPALDRTRGKARFVITKIESSDGTHQNGIYGPEDWSGYTTVYAQRLKPDGKYDPKGEIFKFHPDRHDLHGSLWTKDIQIHGKMQMTFI